MKGMAPKTETYDSLREGRLAQSSPPVALAAGVDASAKGRISKRKGSSTNLFPTMSFSLRRDGWGRQESTHQTEYGVVLAKSSIRRKFIKLHLANFPLRPSLKSLQSYFNLQITTLFKLCVKHLLNITQLQVRVINRNTPHIIL